MSSMTIWHCNLAVSLDGKLARPDGSVDDWLTQDYHPDNAEFREFLSSVDAILMGRDTYDVIRRYGDWPYPGKPSVVLTHRPIADAPEEVATRSGDLAAIVAEMEAAGHGRIWIEGGGKLVRDMLALGKLDILELVIIPIILGDGIPLFPDGTKETRLTLDTAKPWVKGAMHLIYRRSA